MKEDIYLSISRESTGIYKEKGSKFLAFAYPVETEKDVKKYLEALKKKYHDANHHCYAYVIGIDQSNFRSHDAGEPRHSAGDPILNQIRSFNLSDILIVVVRYFGGTKLGIPGLINAYKSSSRNAIENNTIIRKIVYERIIIGFPYDTLNEIMGLIKEYDVQISSQEFSTHCQLEVSIRKSLVDTVMNRLRSIKSLSIIKGK